jgi:peptidoglycan/xylan/chitin deacetylase (PgdA/CDA1 family)
MTTEASKKERVARLLSKTRLLDWAARLDRTVRLTTPLTILGYHRVYDVDPAAYPYDDDLVSATVESFDRQMAYLNKNFEVITFEILGRCLETGRYPKRPAIVTFDDGYRDNYRNAYPILKRHGIPAAFFLPARYIGTREIFGFEKAAYLIKKGWPGRLTLTADRTYSFRIPPGDRQEVIAEVQTLLQRADRRTHDDLIRQMERAIGCDRYPTEPVEIMTWDEVREMSRDGFEIGSHGASHINIAKTTDEELNEEVVESKRLIEKEIGRPVTVLAYPFGQRDSFDDRVVGALRRAGYAFGVSYLHGTDAAGRADPYALSRLHVESYHSMEYFGAMLLFPSVF